MPQGLQDGGAGLRMMWGPLEMLSEAGFSSKVEVLELEFNSFNYCYLCTKGTWSEKSKTMLPISFLKRNRQKAGAAWETQGKLKTFCRILAAGNKYFLVYRYIAP